MNRLMLSLLLMLAAGCQGGQQAGREDAEQSWSQQDLSFTASDGATLYASLRGVDDLSPKPVLIEFSPYGSGSDIPDFGPAYNHVFINARGTGRSNGAWSAVGARDQQDISEFVAWACEQPWSNGRIGLYGFSASAIAIYNTLHLPLPCVEAAALMAGTNDLYRDLLYPGGIPNLVPAVAVGLGVGAPALLSTPLRLADGQSVLEQVLTGLGFVGLTTDVLLTQVENDYWLNHTQRPGPNRFPILANTGFYDVESRGPFESYKMLRDQGVPVHLRLLGAHDGFPNGTPGPFVDYQRWFDRFLRDQHNGVDQEAPVQLLVGHGGYEQLMAGEFSRIEGEDWPLPGTHWQALYLSPQRGGGARSLNDAKLVGSAPDETGRHAYPVLTSLFGSDPYTTSVVAAAGAAPLFEFLPFLNDLATLEPLSLTYTTPPFVRDVDLIGPAGLTLHLMTVLPETDIYAVIADVWPDGRAFPVGVGRLRSSFPHIDPERSVYDSNAEVVQPYPVHSAKDYAAPGELREYHIEFWPLGNRFMTGHRLRLYLTGSPLYALPAPGVNLVFVGGETPSRLMVPVQKGDDLARLFEP